MYGAWTDVHTGVQTNPTYKQRSKIFMCLYKYCAGNKIFLEDSFYSS